MSARARLRISSRKDGAFLTARAITHLERRAEGGLRSITSDAGRGGRAATRIDRALCAPSVTQRQQRLPRPCFSQADYLLCSNITATRRTLGGHASHRTRFLTASLTHLGLVAVLAGCQLPARVR
jgi:hypothetical protein